MLKDGGYKDMPEFMHSYGLKIYKDDDYEEAKQILDAMREADQRAWEEKNGNGKK